MNINAVRDAAMNYEPNVEVEGYAAALDQPKVSLIVAVMRALAPYADDLDADGLRVLLGAAHLVNAHNFGGARADALAIIQTVAAPVSQVESHE